MTASSFARFLSVLLCVALFSSCRRERADACSEQRGFRDSVGYTLEKERIEVQWAQVKGRLDSLLATRSGAAAWERAPRSLEDDASRYADSLVVTDGGLRFKAACVSWSRTWGQGEFDRLALATAMVRPLLSDTAASALEIESDTAATPVFLDVDVLLADQGQKTVRVVFDSLVARIAPDR